MSVDFVPWCSHSSFEDIVDTFYAILELPFHNQGDPLFNNVQHRTLGTVGGLSLDYTTGQNPHSCVRHFPFTSVDFVPWTKTTQVMRTFFGIIQGIERNL